MSKNIPSKEELEQAVKLAQDAFWKSINESFPTIQGGNLDPDNQEIFDDTCTAVVESWVFWNTLEIT